MSAHIFPPCVQLQERFKRFQENLQALIDQPLKLADEKFQKEKAEILVRMAAAEEETARTRQENRGKTRHIAQLEAALEVSYACT